MLFSNYWRGLGCVSLALVLFSLQVSAQTYSARGIGGGGAMASYSINPYSALRFVGTDMGTLFRSVDGGAKWQAVVHDQAAFDSDLDRSAYLGFSADGVTVFFANAGLNPKRSTDGGVTWAKINLPLAAEERILYWASDSFNASFLLAATTKGIWRTIDKGTTWSKATGVARAGKGTFMDYTSSSKRTIYHADDQAIYTSTDLGKTFKKWHTPAGTGIRSFSAGRDSAGVSFAFIDTNGTKACAWVNGIMDVSEADRITTMSECGYVWVRKPGYGFSRKTKEAGRHLRMAENDSKTIYITAGNWVHQYGNKVWVSQDTGSTWQLRFFGYNWDVNPFQPWPADRLEYSAVGLDIGWDDNAFFSFSVNQRNSAEAGSSGHYFLNTTTNKGLFWKSPFTQYADVGPREKGKKWQSTGLEVTSVLKLRFHPSNPQLGYAAMSDMGGMVTEDGGQSWRIARVEYNTNYDYAFDPEQPDWVYAVSGTYHDFPMSWYGGVLHGNGGVYRSMNRGRTWTRLTPNDATWNRQFVSLVFDPIHRVLYAGSQGDGVAYSRDGGTTWQWLTDGMPGPDRIVSQLEVDPENGNVYALLAGDLPNFTNRAATGVYFLDVNQATPSWSLLRGTVAQPDGVWSGYQMWWYPTAFAVDFSRPARDVIWMTDMENQGSWLASGVWKTDNRGSTWTRSTQYTHPLSITIDPVDSNRVYVGGLYVLNEEWGQGGAMYTTDGGATWKKNQSIALKQNLYGVRTDPNNANALFYLFFGGGILYGPRPE